jgi:hypothetical protein
MRTKPDLRKTSLCKLWARGRCPHESARCPWAHGKHELQQVAGVIADGDSAGKYYNDANVDIKFGDVDATSTSEGSDRQMCCNASGKDAFGGRRSGASQTAPRWRR